MSNCTTVVASVPECEPPTWAKRLVELVESLLKQSKLTIQKEAYTTKEVAERLERAEWTVRQWCNLGKVPEAYKVHGKGRNGEWRIPHEAVVRIQNKGEPSAA